MIPDVRSTTLISFFNSQALSWYFPKSLLHPSTWQEDYQSFPDTRSWFLTLYASGLLIFISHTIILTIHLEQLGHSKTQSGDHEDPSVIKTTRYRPQLLLLMIIPYSWVATTSNQVLHRPKVPKGTSLGILGSAQDLMVPFRLRSR